MGSIDNFGYVDLFVDLTLRNNFSVYCVSLFLIIFKIITQNCKISLKLSIQGQQINNGFSCVSAKIRADRC